MHIFLVWTQQKLWFEHVNTNADVNLKKQQRNKNKQLPVKLIGTWKTKGQYLKMKWMTTKEFRKCLTLRYLFVHFISYLLYYWKLVPPQ